MNKRLRIVGRKAENRLIGNGALRRDVLSFIENVPDVGIGTDRAWLDNLIDLLEERYTPRHPSIRDQVSFMVALGSLVSKTPPRNAPATVTEALHYLGDPLGLYFHEEPELKFFPDSPDVGDSACICSFCEEVIERPPAIRFFDKENDTEARLHLDCFNICKDFDLIPENTPRGGKNGKSSESNDNDIS